MSNKIARVDTMYAELRNKRSTRAYKRKVNILNPERSPWCSKTAGCACRIASPRQFGALACQTMSLNNLQQSCTATGGILHADAMNRAADGGRMTGGTVGGCSEGRIRTRSSFIKDVMAKKRKTWSTWIPWREGLLATVGIIFRI